MYKKKVLIQTAHLILIQGGHTDHTSPQIPEDAMVCSGESSGERIGMQELDPSIACGSCRVPGKTIDHPDLWRRRAI